LRISVHLPGIIFREAGCSFGDILSLGTGGAFIKTGCNNLRRDEPVDVIIPLMGMKKELEISSRVIYHISPTPENNYQQGVGISFSRPDPETVREIYEYISHSLLTGVSAETAQPRPESEPSHATPSAGRSREGQRGLFLIS
jgi:Tfp pilus assembly protein PilZ